MSKAVTAEEITQSQSVLKKNLRMGDARQNTHRERERERGTKNVYIHKSATVTNDNQPTFTKGYKVTLYSD